MNGIRQPKRKSVVCTSTRAGLESAIRPTKRKSVVCLSTQAGLNPIRYAQGQVLRNPAYELVSARFPFSAYVKMALWTTEWTLQWKRTKRTKSNPRNTRSWATLRRPPVTTLLLDPVSKFETFEGYGAQDMMEPSTEAEADHEPAPAPESEPAPEPRASNAGRFELL